MWSPAQQVGSGARLDWPWSGSRVSGPGSGLGLRGDCGAYCGPRDLGRLEGTEGHVPPGSCGGPSQSPLGSWCQTASKANTSSEGLRPAGLTPPGVKSGCRPRPPPLQAPGTPRVSRGPGNISNSQNFQKQKIYEPILLLPHWLPPRRCRGCAPPRLGHREPLGRVGLQGTGTGIPWGRGSVGLCSDGGRGVSELLCQLVEAP